MTPWDEFQAHKGRPINKWRHYFAAYEQHLARFVQKQILVIEIGVGTGGSLQMWRRYFGPHSKIVGIDIREACRSYEEDGIEVRVGSQADHGFLRSVVDEFGTPDVVLDDGSHIASHQLASFRFLYERVAAEGAYIIEDLHTAYHAAYEGGLGRPGTFIEFSKSLIDELHRFWIAGQPMTTFTLTTRSIHFHDSMVAFERGVWAPPENVWAGRDNGEVAELFGPNHPPICAS